MNKCLESKWQGPLRAIAFTGVLAIAILFVVFAGSGVSRAEDPSEAAEVEPTIMPAPMAEQIQAGYENYVAEQEAREVELESPANVELREQSQHAYEDLGPGELQELIRSTFGDVLEDLNGDPARFLSDATITHVGEEDAATVRSEGETTLFEAGIPVQAEGEDGELEKVDVSLVHSDGAWVPENPLVELEIGASPDEGLVIGDEEVGITQAGADEGDAIPMGDKNLLFDEVSEESHTDLLVSPTSFGVELFDVLRSIDSPETLRFKFDLPEGAVLRAEPEGGAEVLDAEGNLSFLIPRAWARDAQGSEVPVAMTVEGEQLILTVGHKEGDFAYPILVDPTIYQDWGWWFEQQHLNGREYFTPQLSAGNWWTQIGTKNGNWPTWDGLAVATVNGTLGSGTGGYYIMTPNTGSYIAGVTVNPFYRNNGNGNCPVSSYPHPYDYAGLWNGTNWYMQYETAQTQGWFTMAGPGTWATQFSFGLGSGGITIPCWRHIMAGGIGIWLDDWQSPTVEYVGPTPEGWVKSDATPRTVTVYAADGGLGVQSVRMFGVGTQNWWWNKGSCAGTYDARCPTWESGQVTFTTNGFPYEGRYDGQGGERNFTVQVADPTGKTGQVQRPIWVDATAPSVSLSGQLATVTDETGSVEKPQDEAHDHDQLSLPTYKLLLNADDGADRSGVKEIKIYLDKDPGLEPTAPVTARVTAPAASCPVAGCPRTLSMEYMLRLAGLEPGKHSVWIVAVDKVGNASPPSRNIEFEYFPATGMKDEYVMQHIPLPDGHDYSAESEYHGPEIAVNVINGNVVFHQRDVNVDTERASLELERVYNSQQPVKQDTQWGRGWAISQAPTFEVESGQATATMQRRGTITGAVPVPQANGQSAFSARLRANVTKTTSGYDVEPAETEETEAFDTAGKVQEVVLGNDEPAYLAPRTEEELELMSPGAPTYTSAFGAAGTGNGQFSHPAGVAVDAKGTIWVVDQGNRRVEKFNAAGEFQSAFGSAGSGNGQFGRPTDIAVDAAGNLWVTDAGNSVVDKFNEKGEFLAKFGSYGTGNGQFHEAESIAIDAQGNIWIGDTYNGRLQKFNAAFEFIKVVGAYGSNAGQMIEPTGIDIGPGGAVWVADWGNNRVSVFNASGEFVRQFGSGGTGNGQFARPDVVEVDSRGNVWVGDQNNGRVQQFDQTGKYVAQFGAKGSGVGQFSFSWPMGIASDTKGNLWIADTANNRVQRWAIPAYTPVYASSFGSTGTGNGQFSHPADVAIDAQGNLWVPDKQNNRIQKFNPKGEFLAKYGTAGSGAGQISAPSSIAFDSTGSFWVAEHGNSRLQKFNSSGEALKTAGAYGSANGQFNGPEGVTIAPNGHIFVADTYNYRIQELNAAGEFIKVVNPGGLGAIEPTGIAADPAGNVWVTDWSHNRVVELSEAGALLRSFGTAGSGDGQFNRPDAIEIDGQGNVWVGDQNNSRVQIFNSSAEFVTKFGSGGSGEGQFSFSYPIGFAVTANGSAWIADANNNRIQRWRMAGVVPGGPEPKVVAPYFDAPAVDYEYENGKLAAMQLEDEATKGADPEIALAVEEGKVTEAESAEAGDTVYSYEGPSMTAADGADGETKYTYDTSGRLSSVELPNGTIATILYDGTQRATSVTVDPAGPEGAKATHFTYVNEPRKTTVWGSGLDEITYEIGEDGGVFKWQWAAFPPAIAALTGSLVSQKEQLIEKNKDQTLFVTGNSPHGIASIKVLTNGNSVAYEETCQEPEPPNGKCNQWTMPWVSNSSDFPPGRLDVEVIVTDMAGRQASERLWVTVPPPDPPDPNVVPRPDFDSVKLQREETGLDREKSLNTFQLTELVLELMYEWERADYAPVRAVEQFGVPMRQPELTEMEFRRAYIAQASEVIPEWAEANAPSTYGGYYVDERAGGILRVGFVGTPEQQAASVAALKASGVLMAPARVEPMPVPPAHALVNVQALEPSVANYVSGNPSAAALTDAVGYSADTGRVVVESSNPAALGSIISGQFGAGAPIEVIAATPEMSSLSRYKTDGVVFGGDWMLNGARGGACTANYSGETQVGVTRGVPDIAYFKLTAGHCGDYGDRFWRKAAKSVSSSPSLENPKWAPVGKVGRSGFVAAGPEGSFTDALAIPVEHWKAQSSNVFTGDPNSYLQMYGMSRMKLNRRYCWSGINGGLNCGRAFEILRRSFSDHPGHPTWKMYVYGPNIQGDSGSPVWDEKTGKAVGILSGQKAGPKRGCVVKPQVNNNSWCPVTSVTPLLPFADKSYPIGAIQALGVGFVRGL